MDRHRVLLICMLPLLGEGISRILRDVSDVQLIYLDCAEPGAVESCLRDLSPATVLIAGERADDAATHLISDVLNRWPDIPVVWIELETNVLRVYTSHTIPANSQQLINAIHGVNLAPGAGQARPKHNRRR